MSFYRSLQLLQQTPGLKSTGPFNLFVSSQLFSQLTNGVSSRKLILGHDRKIISTEIEPKNNEIATNFLSGKFSAQCWVILSSNWMELDEF